MSSIPQSSKSVVLRVAIRAPTLLLFGDEDITTPPRFVRSLSAGIADTTTHIVEGAGHGLPWSHPEEFNRVVGEFLEA